MLHTDFQAQFIDQLADALVIRTIFEHLPEISFFVKDCQGRIVTVSDSVLERLGMKHESEFVGRTDAEFYPAHLVAAYLADDAWVFRTGKPLVNRLEIWLDEKGRPDWSLTTKVPLLGKNGKVIGLMGVSRRDLNQTVVDPNSVGTQAVAYLRQNRNRVSTTEELAKGICVSQRTLNRKVNQELGISPYELILRIRVQAAAESLLKIGESISSIALAHGFCDQSHFTQQFRKRVGMTPRQFRVAHRVPENRHS
ncbi:HTH-type transcriptional activator RhaS [Aureliella helgolandensis]|uniref:HTH-type transcriptional activator RhaS n=2 Tax=Aureliella helgolandensis TaxID=2527968 RepID=A0A518G427_9BACT|nr:HTH-type transcriptional activator RhaS [Aureliella helgolandensis]